MQIQVFESLDTLPADLLAGASYPAQPDFFRTLDWYRCLYTGALSGELTPRVYLLRDTTGAALGALFCATRPGGRELLGLSNFYSLGYGLTSVDGAPPPAGWASELATFIAAERPRWQAVDLRLLEADELAASDLGPALAGNGFRVETFFQYENWHLPTDGAGFDDYYAARSSRLRNTISRKEKKLDRAHDWHIRVYTDDDADLTGAIDDYVRIYNSSWKRPEPYPDFTPTLIRTCARLGLLRLGLLYIDGEAAAAQLWINTPQRAIIYKLAYDEAHAALSPGSILSREMFRLALDQDRVAEIDYGVGSEGYKKDWMSAVRTLHGLHALNLRSPLGVARAAVAGLRGVARRLRGPGKGAD